jgi:hypothetical protein
LIDRRTRKKKEKKKKRRKKKGGGWASKEQGSDGVVGGGQRVCFFWFRLVVPDDVSVVTPCRFLVKKASTIWYLNLLSTNEKESNEKESNEKESNEKESNEKGERAQSNNLFSLFCFFCCSSVGKDRMLKRNASVPMMTKMNLRELIQHVMTQSTDAIT